MTGDVTGAPRRYGSDAPVEKIVNYWNEVFARTPVPSVREITTSRRAWIRREWRKQRDELRTAEDFKRLFEYIRDKCPFIMESVASGARWFSFNWLFKWENNFAKVIEGTYEGETRKRDRGAGGHAG